MVRMTDKSVTAILSAQQVGMLDYLTSQCRCLSKFYRVWGNADKPEDLVSPTELGVTVMTPWGFKHLWLVAEDNIKARRGTRGVATWRSVLSLEELSQYNAVAVFYNPAWERGSTWRQSTGNKFKDDYRRLAKPSSLLPHPDPSLRGVYEEITGLMTEEALNQILRDL